MFQTFVHGGISAYYKNRQTTTEEVGEGAYKKCWCPVLSPVVYDNIIIA